MMRAKTFLFIPLAVVGFYFGSWIYAYFTYDIPPQIQLVGIKDNGCYKDTVACNIKADNGYKIAKVTVSLDGELFDLGRSCYIGQAVFSIPFTVDTTELSDGQHTFEIESFDSSYNKNACKETWHFLVDNRPLTAAFLEHEYRVYQGQTVHLRIKANKQIAHGAVSFFSQQYACSSEMPHTSTYECFIPISCEQQPGEHMLAAEFSDAANNVVRLSAKVIVKEYDFPKSKKFQVNVEKLEDEKGISISSKVLEDALEKWLGDSPKKKLWLGRFELPTEVHRISTPFGEIRTTPEKGRYKHKAVDLVSRSKSVIWASQDGKVIIKDRYLMSGNTVVLDHGLGVFTLYFHLDDFADIEVGEMVKKGNPLGKTGKTGYATGDHLHWELRVNNVPVNPLQWTEKNF